MSINEEFDELARRKLEERSFPFHEADWQDAKNRIDAHRRGRNKAWIFGAGLLLLFGGLTWYATRPANAVSTAIAEQHVQNTIPTTAPIASATTVPVRPKATSLHPATASNTPTTAPPNARNAAVGKQATPPIKVVGVNTTAPSSHASQAAPKSLGHVADVITKKRSRTPAQVGGDVVPHTETAQQEPQADGVSEAETKTATKASTGVAVEGKKALNDPAPAPVGSTLVKRPTESSTPDPAAPAQDRTVANTGIATPPSDGHSSVNVPVKEAPAALDQNASGTTSASALSAANADQPSGKVSTAGSDSTSTATDSTGTSASAAGAAPSAPTAAPPIVPDRAPWEISILGGAFDSKSTYTGGNSADWTGNLSGERSIGAGLELMHTGRNIGLGFGLYYGTYAERIRTDAIDASTTTINPYWYLAPVDTAILFITDTLAGQPPTYAGTSIDTTIQVLEQSTDTTTSTQHVRDARDEVNRVSYIEIPLLLDIHLVQGRWSLGLRGGPTISLLTGRRGAVPNAAGDGYLGFSDVAFRELVFGYTARAYVRYRFNAGWSVGISPVIRGQFMNSIDEGDLSRRASAKGLMLGLTYRLR